MSAATSAAHHDIADITEAAVRPMVHAGLRFWVLAGILTLIVGAGVAAYATQVIQGLGVTGYNDSVFWATYEANLVAFIGISYGGAVTSALLRLAGAPWRAPIVRLAEGMALVSLCVGSLFAIIHVGRPDRLWELFVHPHYTSPVVWDMTAIMTYIAATAIFLYLPLIADMGVVRDYLGERAGWRGIIYRALSLGWQGLPEQRRIVNRAMTIIAIAIIPLAVSVHSVLAWAFGLTVRVGWHSTLLAPYFVIAALLSGVAAVIVTVAAYRWAYHLEEYITVKQFRYLGYLMLSLGLVYLYMTVTEMLTESYVLDEETGPLLETMLLGNYAPLFWFFALVGGGIPTVLVILPWTRNVPGITVAAVLAVAGMWVKRLVIVIPPLTQPYLGQPAKPYTMSIIELLVTVGAMAAIPLFMMVLFRFIPVLAITEMEEIAEEEFAAHHERVAVLGTEPRSAAAEGGAR
ncbi:MAG: NrfD/PsrC family molybdoenzyme membrane anchor subunit [Chloroflexota bacterium]